MKEDTVCTPFVSASMLGINLYHAFEEALSDK